MRKSWVKIKNQRPCSLDKEPNHYFLLWPKSSQKPTGPLFASVRILSKDTTAENDSCTVGPIVYLGLNGAKFSAISCIFDRTKPIDEKRCPDPKDHGDTANRRIIFILNTFY